MHAGRGGDYSGRGSTAAARELVITRFGSGEDYGARRSGLAAMLPELVDRIRTDGTLRRDVLGTAGRGILGKRFREGVGEPPATRPACRAAGPKPTPEETMPRLLAALALLLPLSCGAMTVPEEIHNHHAVDGTLSTAGQVTPEQAAALGDAGFGLVVNLAVADAERNAEEGFQVTAQGVSYVQIPVAWEAPTLADLQLFFAVMDARAGRRTLVHCFANYRASAFTYLYRTLRLGVPEEEARPDLLAIWTEEAFREHPQWAAFLQDARTQLGARPAFE